MLGKPRFWERQHATVERAARTIQAAFRSRSGAGVDGELGVLDVRGGYLQRAARGERLHRMRCGQILDGIECGSMHGMRGGQVCGKRRVGHMC